MSNSGPEVVATISDAGVLTAVSPGLTTVTVVHGTVRTTASVEVRTGDALARHEQRPASTSTVVPACEAIEDEER